jgi:hypothetical protein
MLDIVSALARFESERTKVYAHPSARLNDDSCRLRKCLCLQLWCMWCGFLGWSTLCKAHAGAPTQATDAYMVLAVCWPGARYARRVCARCIIRGGNRGLGGRRFWEKVKVGKCLTGRRPRGTQHAGRPGGGSRLQRAVTTAVQQAAQRCDVLSSAVLRCILGASVTITNALERCIDKKQQPLLSTSTTSFASYPSALVEFHTVSSIFIGALCHPLPPFAATKLHEEDSRPSSSRTRVIRWFREIVDASSWRFLILSVRPSSYSNAQTSSRRQIATPAKPDDAHAQLGKANDERFG